MQISKNVKIGWKQRKTPAPIKWQMLSKVLKFIFGALIPIFSGTPLIASRTSDIITFCLGIGIVILSALDMLLGDVNAAADVPVTRHDSSRPGKKEQEEDNSDKI